MKAPTAPNLTPVAPPTFPAAVPPPVYPTEPITTAPTAVPPPVYPAEPIPTAPTAVPPPPYPSVNMPTGNYNQGGNLYDTLETTLGSAKPAAYGSSLQGNK